MTKALDNLRLKALTKTTQDVGPLSNLGQTGDRTALPEHLDELRIVESTIDRTAQQLNAAAEELRSLHTEFERRIKARTAELRERESMLREIHHRVKNSLQVISSLISMQIRSLEDEPSRRALGDCQSRLMTMSKIHEILYQSADYAQVPFAKYAKDLTTRILSASGSPAGNITLEFELEEIFFPVEQAIPCGLILNELVVNSLKHAFQNRVNGTIHVELRQKPDRAILLAVSDNGIGISPRVDLGAPSTLGMQLVMTLVKQIEGQLNVIRQSGSSFRLTFLLEAAA